MFCKNCGSNTAIEFCTDRCELDYNNAACAFEMNRPIVDRDPNNPYDFDSEDDIDGN